MELITFESEAFQQIMKKLDDVHKELIRLQDPVKELSSQWIDTYDVMKILNVSRRTLTKYLAKGLIKHPKIENKNFFKLKDVEEFLANSPRTRSYSKNTVHGNK